MLDEQARRGPDAEGMEFWHGAVLGHRRLSIFDLSPAGRQPMLSGDRSAGVVFNGAIYNFRELRRQLELTGSRFRTRTDTEVLLHGYRTWGLDGLVSRLRGMFAFALWDDHLKKLFLVRDRLGVKPLLYAVRDGSIAFASTAAALAGAGFGETLDDLAIAEFLEYGFITDARSIYRGVSKLPAAHILEWSGGGTQTRRYWHPLETRCQTSIRFEEAVEETGRLFLRAVQRRLDADVPVGVLLSGGVDSSLVCWAISHLGADITAHTVGTPGAEVDETADARATAAKLGIRHVVHPVSAEDNHLLDDLLAAYGEPFASGSALGILVVSQAIRQSATVVLTGDGGDDVFLGYPWYRLFLRTQRAARWMPEWAASAWRLGRGLIPETGPFRRLKNLINYTTGGLGAVVHANPGLPALGRMRLLGGRLDTIAIAERSLPQTLPSARNLLGDSLAFAQDHHFTGEFMTKVDGGAMYHALEARAPFLDQDLWEFAASLPYEVRLHGGQLKAILRALARRHLGERVAAGRKRGFSIPVDRWLAGRWYALFRELFADSLLERHGYIRSQPLLDRMARARQAGTAPLPFWYLFVLEQWLRRRVQTGLVRFSC